MLPLYVIEPALWRQPDTAGRHWACIAEAPGDIDAGLVPDDPVAQRQPAGEETLQRSFDWGDGS